MFLDAGSSCVGGVEASRLLLVLGVLAKGPEGSPAPPDRTTPALTPAIPLPLALEHVRPKPLLVLETWFNMLESDVIAKWSGWAGEEVTNVAADSCKAGRWGGEKSVDVDASGDDWGTRRTGREEARGGVDVKIRVGREGEGA